MLVNAFALKAFLRKVAHVCLVTPKLANSKSLVIIKIVMIIYGLHQRNAMTVIKLTMMVAQIVKSIKTISVLIEWNKLQFVINVKAIVIAAAIFKT